MIAPSNSLATHLTLITSVLAALIAVLITTQSSAAPVILPNVQRWMNRFFKYEAIVEETSNACAKELYQSYDGSCNNLDRINMGKVGGSYKHLVRGNWSRPVLSELLPDPRHVSRVLHNSVSQKNNGPLDVFGTAFPKFDEAAEPNGINSFFVEFGQFVNHDLELNKNTDPANASIEIPFADVTNDPVYQPAPANGPPSPFNPSGVNPLIMTDSLGRVDSEGKLHITNLANSYLDLSNIYGTDTKTNKALRSLTGGQLLTGSYEADGGVYAPGLGPVTYSNLLPSGQQTGLETGVFNAPQFSLDVQGVSGDPRAIENVFLATQHLIWIREHNRIASVIASSEQGKSLTDEEIFQTARRINIAQYQSVVFNEFVPKLVSEPMPTFKGYDHTVDTTTSVEFASAALRYGHSNTKDFDLY
ncbi:hypothetical protein HDU76_002528, partial [Blyttiomyces sp. JEL0837]